MREYPKYEMIVNGEKQFLIKQSAASAYNCGWIHVKFGYWVIDKPDSNPREMTNEDKMIISDLADEIDASK